MSLSDDNPGVFTFMVGLIIVVLGGVALSIALDKRFSFSRSSVRLQREIDSSEGELERLRRYCTNEARMLSGLESSRRSGLKAYEAVQREQDAMGQRWTVLTAKLETIRNEVSQLDKEFAGYRGKYRDQARAAAVGEELGELKIRGGRVYHQVVISRVTDVGMEIRHEHGFARLHAPDLDPSFQSRFQWCDEERRAKLAEERANRDAVGQIPTRGVGRSFRQRGVTAGRQRSALSEGVNSRRRKVIALRIEVERLRLDHERALAAVATGNRATVPGRLETWPARSERLGNELSRAQAKLAEAKRDLSKVAPDDQLLRRKRSSR